MSEILGKIPIRTDDISLEKFKKGCRLLVLMCIISTLTFFLPTATLISIFVITGVAVYLYNEMKKERKEGKTK